jgi:hypothetical protein
MFFTLSLSPLTSLSIGWGLTGCALLTIQHEQTPMPDIQLCNRLEMRCSQIQWGLMA